MGLWIMFQSLALRGLLLLVIAILVKADVFVDDAIEEELLPFVREEFVLELKNGLLFRLTASFAYQI